VAETTFNRELGAAPAGITRFGQLRTDDGGNVTINATREFASDGSFETSDVFSVTSSATGTGTVTLFAGSKSVGKVFILSGTDGSVLGEVAAPKISNRSDVSFTFSVGADIENYLYVTKLDRSPCEYRVTYTAA
jgi:hypothetical protein|tara:strand:+ start:717 stop:1118 length:402 start_codon:yes stop_codon:yes gene_type:complete